MSSARKIIVSGANGKMGHALIQAIDACPEAQLVGAIERQQSPIINQDAGLAIGLSTNVLINDSMEAVINQTKADVLIDFTRPEATMDYLPICVKNKVALVIGTTGFSAPQKQLIENASKQIPIVFSPNFSIGVNLTFALVGLATRVLNSAYDVEIIESHHRHKVDAPSGTALRLGEVVAENRQVKLEDVAVYSREGHTGARKTGSIGFATIRGGDVVGDHTTLFANDGERIEITHKASSRLTFANGAVYAACWLQNKTTGLFNMQDVLGISHLK